MPDIRGHSTNLYLEAEASKNHVRDYLQTLYILLHHQQNHAGQILRRLVSKVSETEGIENNSSALNTKVKVSSS